MSNDALHLVTLEYTSDNFGGGSMKLQLAVDSVNGTLTGTATGTINAGTQHPANFYVAHLAGHMHYTGLGEITMVGAVSGQAAVSFPPPAIGTYLAPFTASLSVNNDWNGKGAFSIGTTKYPCTVKRIS